MADLSNLKIKNTYQLLLQADSAGNVQNLQGTTPNPLIVNGNLRYVDGNQEGGYFLKSDVAGNATWSQLTVSGDIYISAATMDDTVLKLHTTSGTTINVPVSYWSTDGNGNYSNSGLTGNVGIGTSSPTTKLDVVGTGKFSGKLTISDNQYLSWSSNSRIVANSSYMQFQVDATDKMRILANGNVGIGTTEPTEKLQVDGNVKISLTNGGNLQFRNGSAANALFSNTYNIIGASGSISDFNTYVYGNNPYSIWTNNTNRLSVTGAGDVGIGTTTPNQKLTVIGGVSATTDVYINGTIYSGSSKLQNLFLTKASLSGSSAVDKVGPITANQFTVWKDSDKTLGSMPNLRIGGNGSPSQAVISGLISATTLSAATVYTSNNAFVGGKVIANSYLLGQETFASLSTDDEQNVILLGNSNTIDGLRLGRNTTDRIEVKGDMVSNSFMSNSFISGSTLSAVTLNIQDKLTVGTIANVNTTNVIASGNISGATIQGVRTFSAPSATNNRYMGDVLYDPYGNEYSVDKGSLYCLTGGTWVKSDADVPNLSKGFLGIALETNSSGGFLIKGYYTLTYDPGTISNPIYISKTSGFVTDNDASLNYTGTFVRIVGYVMDSVNGQIWFDPDKTWVELV